MCDQQHGGAVQINHDTTYNTYMETGDGDGDDGETTTNLQQQQQPALIQYLLQSTTKERND